MIATDSRGKVKLIKDIQADFSAVDVFLGWHGFIFFIVALQELDKLSD
ncbi:hypothetical protein STRMA_1035 [Streptococcus macacae NCTC 11558]|uniref:Uncharacterized protein n=1 Tax=Streptococcus macacae NCTC 11558 TaxID=764298 RepID=G5JUP5_9STRE|nr:hypothetical protein STRMA_1035 [Streptococcus macacae NCTC 11558]